eukprot:gene24704-10340_t
MQAAKDFVNLAAQDLKDLIIDVSKNISKPAEHSQEVSSSHPRSGGVGPVSTALAQASSSAQPFEARVHRFQQELSASRVNIHAIKRLAFDGIPDHENLRATVWKLILGYLSPSSEDWPKDLAARRTQYHVFCDRKEEVDDPLRAKDVTSSDHPLSVDPCSSWNTYFEDNEIMIQVERDVMRTHPDMPFFSGEDPEAVSHREEMKRALFMYAKLNPGLRYIQGMNELISPLYYLFKNDSDLLARKYGEADAFWCFMDLISEFRDHFCQKLDNAETGIRATMRRLMRLLKYCDHNLWHHIEVVEKVDPQFYSFRWITLLLSQEFAFSDTLRIWDTILSDPQGRRMDWLLRICAAIILNQKGRLMKSDFSAIMKTLQRYPPVDIQALLKLAASLPSCSVALGVSL